MGQKIDLQYNIETMRITDDDPDGYAEQQARFRPQSSASDIMNKIKPQATINDSVQETVEPTEKKVVADVKAAGLHKMLAQIKARNN